MFGLFLLEAVLPFSCSELITLHSQPNHRWKFKTAPSEGISISAFQIKSENKSDYSSSQLYFNRKRKKIIHQEKFKLYFQLV